MDLTRALTRMREEGAIMSAGTGYKYRIYDSKIQRYATGFNDNDPDADHYEWQKGWHKAAIDPDAVTSESWEIIDHAPMCKTERMALYSLLIRGFEVLYYVNRGHRARLARARREGADIKAWYEVSGDLFSDYDALEFMDATMYATGRIQRATITAGPAAYTLNKDDMAVIRARMGFKETR